MNENNEILCEIHCRHGFIKTFLEWYFSSNIILIFLVIFKIQRHEV